MPLFPKRKLAKLELKDRKRAERRDRGPKFPGVGVWLNRKWPSVFKLAYPPVPERKQSSGIVVPRGDSHHISHDHPDHFGACDTY